MEIAASIADNKQLGINSGWQAMDVNHYYGASLKSLRLQRGLTQAALATMVGLERADIASLEQGRSEPGLLTALRLANALDIRDPARTRYTGKASRVSVAM